MKKILILLFSVGLTTAVFAQRGDRNGYDSRSYDNSYQSSPYSYNDQYRYDRNPGYNHQYESRRQRLARERYEYEMMMRRRQALLHQRMYDGYYSPYGVTRRPSLQIRIGIGGRRY
jgi:hypothetical protein